MLYGITSNIQTNMVLNKGILELGGIALPNTIMANNKTEARERAEREGLFFALAFIAPFVFLPLLNKSFLKLHKISDKLNGFDDKIMHLSKKYLTKDGQYLEEGMNELLKAFKGSKNSNYEKINLTFQNILNKFPDKEILRKKLIKTHTHILLSDFIISSLMIGSVPWISNVITKKRTGKTGFSAKFKMVDEKKLKDDSKKHEETKNTKMIAMLGTILISGIGLYATLRNGMLAKNSSKLGNFIKKHADKFDYKDGIFMSRAVLLLITLCSDMPSTILSSRDKEEVKYNTVRNLALNGIFFGGDLILNNIAAQAIDKMAGTKLLDESKLKEKNTFLRKMTCPLKTFKEIDENKIKLDEATLRKTKRAGIGVFWGNFVLLCGLLGFALPYVLNKNLRKNVKEENKTTA